MSVLAIDVEALSVRLGRHLALDRLTLALPEGAFLAILGPNGGGKTTLLKVLLGLIAPNEGRARVFGQAPADVAPQWIGYVPQVKTLDRSFPALSLELVVSGLRARWPARIGRSERQAALEALGRVGAAHLADRPIAQLSGGELQRVFLARSFARGPRLVLLDEPAAGMDVAGEADMYALLEAYQRTSGATVLMVTHDWEAARHHAGHVLVLNRRAISFGPPAAALGEAFMRQAFGHIGHDHAMMHGATGDD